MTTDPRFQDPRRFPLRAEGPLGPLRLGDAPAPADAGRKHRQLRVRDGAGLPVPGPQKTPRREDTSGASTYPGDQSFVRGREHGNRQHDRGARAELETEALYAEGSIRGCVRLSAWPGQPDFEHVTARV